MNIAQIYPKQRCDWIEIFLMTKMKTNTATQCLNRAQRIFQRQRWTKEREFRRERERERELWCEVVDLK